MIDKTLGNNVILPFTKVWLEDQVRWQTSYAVCTYLYCTPMYEPFLDFPVYSELMSNKVISWASLNEERF